jgi:hypothetical protein
MYGFNMLKDCIAIMLQSSNYNLNSSIKFFFDYKCLQYMFKQTKYLLSVLFFLTWPSFGLGIFNHNNASSGIINHLHNHALVHNNSSSVTANPALKTTAKVVACKTIGKGVCLGATAAKYADKELTESTPSK